MATTKNIKPAASTRRPTKHDRELAHLRAQVALQDAERVAAYAERTAAVARAALQGEHERLGARGPFDYHASRGYVESLHVLADLREFQCALRSTDDRVLRMLQVCAARGCDG